MAKTTRAHVGDLRGAGRLAIDATLGVTALVEAMHRTIASGPALLGRPLERPARRVTATVYGSIRGVTTLVGAGLDLALSQLGPLLAPVHGAGARSAEREAIVAALNGVLGDHLAETGNPLAIEMGVRRDGRSVPLERAALRAAYPEANGRLLVLVHGSCMNDLQWNRKGHDHGKALARDLGYTPIYLHYNSGLHISTNGRTFAELLERLVAEWPERVEELTIVGHSMGGLVARSACHAGESAGHAWRRQLRRLVCLGSPHHGATLERRGNRLELSLGISRYTAPLATLGRLRSAGITDLRFGNVLDQHWQGRDRFSHHRDSRGALSLPDGVRCYALAASLSPRGVGSLRGDGLVSVASALGRHRKSPLDLGFPEDRQHVAFGAGHFDLLSKAEVYTTIAHWLSTR